MGRWVGSPLIDRGCPPLSGGWESQYIAEVGRRGGCYCCRSLCFCFAWPAKLPARSTPRASTIANPRPSPSLRLSLFLFLCLSLELFVRSRGSPSPSSALVPYLPSRRASTKKPTLKIGATDHGHCCQMPRAFAFSRRFLEK